MFAIEAAFLTGRYIATSFDDRLTAEWPPHPARLFSALVAACFEALDPAEDERAALLWLERQGAPEITASEASAREAATVFVPVNDTSVVESLDKPLAALDAARAEVEEARAKGAKALAGAEKKLAKVTASFAEAARRAIAEVPAGKEGKAAPGEAASLLPERRKRQPRMFPSLTPDDPRVVFSWPHAEPSREVLEALDRLCARVARLGHSSSLVSLRLGDKEALPARWVPLESGGSEERVLRVVGPGQLEALCAAFVQQGDAPGRVMPAVFQRYARPAPLSTVGRAPRSVFGEDWMVLARARGPRLPSTRVVDVARTVRKALMAAFGPGAPEILSGHRVSGEPSVQTHLAYVPLPFVGHERADGAILGVALVFPREAGREQRRAVYEAIHRWESSVREGDEDTPALPIFLGRAGELYVTRSEGEAPQTTLQPETWCAEATQWASATPVALDRNPGDLRSEDAKKEAAAYAEAESTVAAACEHIGLPRPSRVVVTPAAPLAGSDKARAFPPFKVGTQRVLVHATLEFAEPVRGPILIGAGRYFGLGLFRPRRDHG